MCKCKIANLPHKLKIVKTNLRTLVVFFAIAFGIDQGSKFLIVKSINQLDPPKEVIGSFLRFRLAFNPYGVFSISFGPEILYYILSILAIIILCYIGITVKDRVTTVVFGFIIGGAVGNIIDRLRLNYVVDFIDMGIGNLRWFTYNLADAFITVGVILLLVREVVYKKKVI